MADGWHPETGPANFLAATRSQAHLVLAADGPEAAYEAAMAFLGLAMSAMSATPPGTRAATVPAALSLIWGALSDEMDAPGTGSAEQDAAAAHRMRRAATEWLAAADTPDGRTAYLDRWMYSECGYERAPS